MKATRSAHIEMGHPALMMAPRRKAMSSDLLKALLPLAVIVFLVGCATTHQPAVGSQQDFTRAVSGSKAAIFSAAEKALISQGYEILSSDRQSGVISTAKRQMHPAGHECDCKAKKGHSCKKHQSGAKNVSIGILVAENRITIRPTVEGTHQKEHAAHGTGHQCALAGKIEETLFEAVLRAMVEM